ncbi:MAG: oligosaccharide flippase family protein [Gaiellaceae bacterium]
MPSRLLWRRFATAAGLYGSTVLGVLGTVVAARSLSKDDFGLFATVFVAAGFFQVLLDLTVEESLTKYGFRYTASEQWGRLRGLFRSALRLKLLGGLLAGLALLALAPLADTIFSSDGLTWAFVAAAPLPLLQSPENVSATALLLRGRYDLRGLFQTVSTGLRLIAIAVGAQYGVVEMVIGIGIAQAVSTCLVGMVGLAAFRRFPQVPAERLGEDRKGIVSFVLQSSAATGLLSLRAALAPLLLGVAAGPTQVGIFRIAQAPQSGFAAASSPVRLILLTEQTRDWERGAEARVLAGVRRYTVIATPLMLVVVPIFLWLMPDLIRLVFGARYLDATDAARLILVAAGLQLAIGWTKSLPVAIGRPNLRLVTHGLETVVLLPLVVVLGLEWGATGAAAATLVATVVFALAWAVVFARIRRETPA